MIRRTFWFGLGVGFGAGLAILVMKRVQDTIERYQPGNVAGRASASFGNFRENLQSALSDVRSAAQSRESEIWDEVNPQ